MNAKGKVLIVAEFFIKILSNYNIFISKAYHCFWKFMSSDFARCPYIPNPSIGFALGKSLKSGGLETLNSPYVCLFPSMSIHPSLVWQDYIKCVVRGGGRLFISTRIETVHIVKATSQSSQNSAHLHVTCLLHGLNFYMKLA